MTYLIWSRLGAPVRWAAAHPGVCAFEVPERATRTVPGTWAITMSGVRGRTDTSDDECLSPIFDFCSGQFHVWIWSRHCDLTVVAMSNAYLSGTMTRREEILGRGRFDVFPDGTGDPSAPSVRNLRASSDRVHLSRAADEMAAQTYDMRRPDSERGALEERFLSCINSPVFGTDGELADLIHSVEDMPGLMRLRHVLNEHEKRTDEFCTKPASELRAGRLGLR